MNKNIAVILLAILLIIWGLALILGLSFNGLYIVEGILAVASGICFLIGK